MAEGIIQDDHFRFNPQQTAIGHGVSRVPRTLFEVVRNSAGKLADGFEFLRLLKLAFQGADFRHVLRKYCLRFSVKAVQIFLGPARMLQVRK